MKLFVVGLCDIKFFLVILKPLLPFVCAVDVNRIDRQKVKSELSDLVFPCSRGRNAAD